MLEPVLVGWPADEEKNDIIIHEHVEFQKHPTIASPCPATSRVFCSIPRLFVCLRMRMSASK